jgi:Short C-terminal domain
MRTAAFTGSTDSMFTRIAGRQGGRWAAQTVRQAFPTARSQRPTTPSAAPHRPTLRDLKNLRERGVLTDSEFERLRTLLEV